MLNAPVLIIYLSLRRLSLTLTGLIIILFLIYVTDISISSGCTCKPSFWRALKILSFKQRNAGQLLLLILKTSRDSSSSRTSKNNFRFAKTNRVVKLRGPRSRRPGGSGLDHERSQRHKQMGVERVQVCRRAERAPPLPRPNLFHNRRQHLRPIRLCFTKKEERSWTSWRRGIIQFYLYLFRKILFLFALFYLIFLGCDCVDWTPETWKQSSPRRRQSNRCWRDWNFWRARNHWSHDFHPKILHLHRRRLLGRRCFPHFGNNDFGLQKEKGKCKGMGWQQFKYFYRESDLDLISSLSRLACMKDSPTVRSAHNF